MSRDLIDRGYGSVADFLSKDIQNGMATSLPILPINMHKSS